MEQFEIEARIKANLPKSHKKKKSGKPNFDKEALTLWSLVVRQRAGGCELCNTDAELDRFGRMVKNLDAHHIVGRNNYLHRYSLNNGIALCKSCHAYNREWSPHYDYNSVLGFKKKFEKEDHLKYRFNWWAQEGSKKMQPTITAEEHYYRLLDAYVSLVDGESKFPMEMY
tara:strand:+ start:5162 stop:5671 length:510 start_codon:yes stop_codon:yes gene_type:complete